MTAAPSSNTLQTTIPPQLVPSLKALRLGGMQDTLPLRLDQAQQQRLGYLEFVGGMSQCSCKQFGSACVSHTLSARASAGVNRGAISRRAAG